MGRRCSNQGANKPQKAPFLVRHACCGSDAAAEERDFRVGGGPQLSVIRCLNRFLAYEPCFVETGSIPSSRAQPSQSFANKSRQMAFGALHCHFLQRVQRKSWEEKRLGCLVTCRTQPHSVSVATVVVVVIVVDLLCRTYMYFGPVGRRSGIGCGSVLEVACPCMFFCAVDPNGSLKPKESGNDDACNACKAALERKGLEQD